MNRLGLPPPRTVLPGLLDEILSEFAERGIKPDRLRILRRAIERGCPEDLATAIADAAERLEKDV